MAEHRIALIGFGAIGGQLAGRLAAAPGLSLGVLIRSRKGRDIPASTTAFEAAEDLLAWRPSLIVECAGQDAVRTVVPQFLEHGVACVLASVGALADPVIQAALDAAARAGGTRIRLASGAIGGLDALAAASNGAIERVGYTGSKPPVAWRGTPAEAVCDLSSLSGPVLFFEGDARQAATRFPQNANVAATIALAGVGFEQTNVRLIADPSLKMNRHEVEAAGQFGRFRFRIDNAVSPDNPKTSWLTALSLEQAVRDHLLLKRL
jgi:aspartate dehydrogenase